MAQRALLAITGMGDYKVSMNSLYAGSVSGSPPPSFDPSKHSVRITHREFLLDVRGSTSFATAIRQKLTVSNDVLFPWLSSLANSFEEYRFHGLIFEYKPTSGVAVSGTNPSLGAVMLATQYNAYARPFTSKTSIDGYEYSVSTLPDTCAICPIECDPKLNPAAIMYTDVDGFLASGDSRLNSIGYFNVATSGQLANGNTLGELWVSYDVELIKPRLSAAYYGSGDNLYSYLRATSTTAIFQQNTPFVGLTQSNFVYGGADLLDSWNPTNSTLPIASDSTRLYFPPDLAAKLKITITLSSCTVDATHFVVCAQSALAVNGWPKDATVSPDGNIGFVTIQDTYQTGNSSSTFHAIASPCPIVGAVGSAVSSTVGSLTMGVWLKGVGTVDPLTGRPSTYLDFSPVGGIPAFPFNIAGVSTPWALSVEITQMFNV